jgi:hypothetical protein
MNKNQSFSEITEGLSEKELNCLNEVKLQMKDRLSKHKEFFTSWNILRFCRARYFEVDKVRTMIDNYLDFREKYDYAEIEKMDQKNFEDIYKNYAKGYFGWDYEGRLVIVDKLSQIYPQKIFGFVDEKLIVSCLIGIYEHLMHIIFPILSKIHNRRVDKVLLIIDLKDVSVLKFFDKKTFDFLRLFSKLASDFHPEILGQNLIINTPFLFKGIWKVCKGMLDKNTQEKMELLSGSGLDKLSKIMDIENLPESLGGKCKSPFSIYDGPWKEEYIDAIKRRSFYLRDRSLEYQYFYTNDERKAIETEREQAGTKISEDAELIKLSEEEVKSENVQFSKCFVLKESPKDEPDRNQLANDFVMDIISETLKDLSVKKRVFNNEDQAFDEKKK